MTDRHAENSQLTDLQTYRSQTMKDYGLMIEYKHMKHHVPSGIYVLPNFDEPRVWHGVIFIHQGLYRNGIFKFSIKIPEQYNATGTYPKITFYSKVFHPYVYPESNDLDLLPKFPTWDPDLHYIVSVLVYMKSIFYSKEFSPDVRRVANGKALDLYDHTPSPYSHTPRASSHVVYRFRRHPEAYVEQVDACVQASLTNLYQNEPGSSLRFTKPIPAHETLRQEFLQQLEPSPSAFAHENPSAEEQREEAVTNMNDVALDELANQQADRPPEREVMDDPME
ncbi:hypothetical protein DYB25_000443 [Aphanomyces astaci]|uniref:UBC core domain-containing protein n=1 Tax=Aphanomyces astaci TaxID=112090 RepID=A0A396ZXZ2_APHAT|nr:hypothetical protein DYB36_001463 [Aphanomyces astaci]RHY16120.1 hypothetical protein DYB25_000443 [Aphanomyces astaci]RHY37907.1 hypothetical protein DYB34_002373 [Aphanomyces astaci]